MTFWPTAQPDMRPLPSGRYFLNEDHRHSLAAYGSLTHIVIPEGTQTDGLSVPRILWSLTGFTPDGRTRAAALCHDYIYSKGGDQQRRKLADQQLLHDLRLSNVREPDALMIYAAVRCRGWLRWGTRHPKNRKRRRPPHRK